MVHKILNLNPYNRGLISKEYAMIQNTKPLTWANTKADWEEDIGGE